MIAKSKETELGRIPPDWEVKTLRELQFDISDGNYSSKYPKASDFRLMGAPFIRANNIRNMTVVDDDLRFISHSQHQELQKGHLKAGDILITTRGEIGQIAFVPQRHIDSNINAQIVRINVSKSNVDNKFFGYFCSSDFAKIQFELLQTGSALKQLPVGRLLDLKIILPKKKDEQKVIAEKIGDIADLIFGLEKLIAKKRDIKQATMQQLLTGKTRLPGFTKKDGFKKTEYGQIPNDWTVRPLPEVMDFTSGKAHEPFVTENGEYVVVNSKFISSDGEVRKFCSHNVCPAKQNDILMVMSDLPNGKALAKVFVADHNNLYAVNQRVCILRPKQDDYNYLAIYLNRNKYFLKFNDGVSQTHLLNDVFRKCPIILPDKQEQTAIAMVIGDQSNELLRLNAKLEKLKLLKQGMMQELLTGRIRLI